RCIHRIRYLILSWALGVCTATHALVYTVGPSDQACSYHALQPALTAAYNQANAVPAVTVDVRLVHYDPDGAVSIVFYDESDSLTVPAGAFIRVLGRYADCAGAYDGVHTAIDGHNGYSSSIGPVLNISVGDGGTAYLQDLDIGSGINDNGAG